VLYGGGFQGRTNRELEELNKGENIVKWIKGQRISWLGYLERIEENRMPKKIFTQELEGTRRRGRSRKGWREEVERDLQVLGVRRWRELVIDRGKWRGILRQDRLCGIVVRVSGYRYRGPGFDSRRYQIF